MIGLRIGASCATGATRTTGRRDSSRFGSDARRYRTRRCAEKAPPIDVEHRSNRSADCTKSQTTISNGPLGVQCVEHGSLERDRIVVEGSDGVPRQAPQQQTTVKPPAVACHFPPFHSDEIVSDALQFRSIVFGFSPGDVADQYDVEVTLQLFENLRRTNLAACIGREEKFLREKKHPGSIAHLNLRCPGSTLRPRPE